MGYSLRREIYQLQGRFVYLFLFQANAVDGDDGGDEEIDDDNDKETLRPVLSGFGALCLVVACWLFTSGEVEVVKAQMAQSQSGPISWA